MQHPAGTATLWTYTWHLSHDVHPGLLLRNTLTVCGVSWLCFHPEFDDITRVRVNSMVWFWLLCVCMQYFPFSCRRVWQWVHVLCSGWQATTSTLIISGWSPLHFPTQFLDYTVPNHKKTHILHPAYTNAFLVVYGVCMYRQQQTHTLHEKYGSVWLKSNRMMSWVWIHTHTHTQKWVYFFQFFVTSLLAVSGVSGNQVPIEASQPYSQESSPPFHLLQCKNDLQCQSSPLGQWL